MSDDLWKRIKGVTEIVGISGDNYNTMKFRKHLPDKWVIPVFEALRNQGEQVELSDIYALTNNSPNHEEHRNR